MARDARLTLLFRPLIAALVRNRAALDGTLGQSERRIRVMKIVEALSQAAARMQPPGPGRSLSLLLETTMYSVTAEYTESVKPRLRNATLFTMAVGILDCPVRHAALPAWSKSRLPTLHSSEFSHASATLPKIAVEPVGRV